MSETKDKAATAPLLSNAEKWFDTFMDSIHVSSYIRASCRLTMMSVLTDVGLRDDKVWEPSEDVLLEKLMEVADKQSTYINKLVEEDVAKQIQAKIASGELMVAKTVTGRKVQFGMWQCENCEYHGWTALSKFCPGCGAKIIEG